MNLAKLFEMQKELDARILAEHPVREGEDRLAKKILALQVELGELANCWRGFKYWSYNQKPRRVIYEICEYCEGRKILGFQRETCWYCCGKGLQIVKRPLLEEYVDCLHFILSIGMDINIDTNIEFGQYVGPNVVHQFNFVFQDIASLSESIYEDFPEEDIIQNFYELVLSFIGLGELLGFTWEQIEQAYFQKNKINHQRQEEGY